MTITFSALEAHVFPRPMTADELDHWLRTRARMKLRTVDQFLGLASQIYGVPTECIRGKSRKPRLVRARHWVCYHAWAERRSSNVEIGRRLGGRDHSSVIFGSIAHAMRHRLAIPGDRHPAEVYPTAYEGPEPTLERPWSPDQLVDYRVGNGGARVRTQTKLVALGG